jgi:hypothetical protein
LIINFLDCGNSLIFGQISQIIPVMGGAVSVKNKPVKSLSTENYMLPRENQVEARNPSSRALANINALESSNNNAPKIKRINSESSIQSRHNREQLSMSFKLAAEKYHQEIGSAMNLSVDPLGSPASTASVTTISPANIYSMKKQFSFNHVDVTTEHYPSVPVIQEENEPEAMIDCIADAFAPLPQLHPELNPQPQQQEEVVEQQNIPISTAHERYSPVIVLDESQVIEETREKFFQTLEIVKRRRSSVFEQQATNTESVLR